MTQDVLQKWPHIRTVAIIETDRANMVTNEVTHSIRYYITTLERDRNFSTCAVELRLRRQYSSHADTCLPLGSKIDPLI